MTVLLLLLLVCAGLGALSLLTAIISWLHSFWRRLIKNTMRNTANIKPQAKVTDVKPEIHKADGMFAFINADVIIEFSDGS